MASSASTVHVSFVVAFLLTTTTVMAISNATVSINNATATSLRPSTAALPATASSAQNVSHQYTCYLCQKSRSMMIRRCPIAQDDCHLSCLTLPTPAPPSPPRAVAAAVDRNADDCYLMKVYPDRSWVVVDVVSCKVSAPACYLVCGKGDEHGGDGGSTGRTTLVTPGGTMPHGLPEFQRCGNHLAARGHAGAG